MSWQGSIISKVTKGKLTKEFLGGRIKFDSRLITPGDIYIALPGKNHDSHNFLNDARKNGATGAITTADPKKFGSDIPAVIVKDTKEALNKLAIHRRNSMKAKFIAITGSVGKTSTKEMLKLTFSANGKTDANSGNYNNDLGVPLTLASFDEDLDFAIVEIGMNHRHEILPLVKMVSPDLAIITAIEPVHIEYFSGLEEIALEKSDIFGSGASKYAIINSETNCTEILIDQANKNKLKKYFTGKNKDAFIEKIELSNNDAKIFANILGKKISYHLNATSNHQISNSIIAILATGVFNLDPKISANNLTEFKLLRGRGEIVKFDKTTLFDESYSSNPVALKLALDNFAKNSGVKLAILSSMAELGKDSKNYHKKIVDYQSVKNIDKFILIGEEMKYFYDQLNESQRLAFYDSVEEIEDRVYNYIISFDFVLAKGSLSTRLYHLIGRLRQQYAI